MRQPAQPPQAAGAGAPPCRAQARPCSGPPHRLCRWDTGPRAPPPGFDPTCKGSDLSTYYCFGRFNSTTVAHWCYDRRDGACPEVTAADIRRFADDMGACMRVRRRAAATSPAVLAAPMHFH